MLNKFLSLLLEFIKGFVLYDYGKTKQDNKQLKENEKLREEYEDIDDMDISANDVYTKWLHSKK